MRNTNRFLNTLLLALAGLLLIACGGGGGGGTPNNNPQDPPPPPQGNKSVTISWVAPSTYDDGSTLEMSQIGGYRVYFGSSAGSMALIADIADANTTQHTISNVAAGDYVMAIAVYDANDVEGNTSSTSPINI